MRVARPVKMWSRRTMLVAAGLMVGLLTLQAGASSAAPGGHDRPRRPDKLPPPPQMHALDFMLGTVECTRPGQTEIKTRTVTWRTLNGHYYYSHGIQYGTAPTPGVNGMAVYGWNPVDGTFIMQYHDNWGTTGTATSPGWSEGTLRFTGKLLQVLDPDPTGSAEGITLDVTGVRRMIGPDRFILTHTATTSDGDSISSKLDCRRRR